MKKTTELPNYKEEFFDEYGYIPSLKNEEELVEYISWLEAKLFYSQIKPISRRKVINWRERYLKTPREHGYSIFHMMMEFQNYILKQKK